MRTLNLGILAHVDAGKTTLTERLLYAAGAIDHIGSVDSGTTQTDYLALERERGITIRSAVASFAIDDVAVNLIDTPGHPDFIAEVERVLSVLDAAVLVVSAVEGIQPQTPLLMRALQRLRVPTLLFVNKIDRAGANSTRVTADLRERLALNPVGLGSVLDEGTRDATYVPGEDDAWRTSVATALADNDDRLLEMVVDGRELPTRHELMAVLAGQTRNLVAQPTIIGSALTGVGVEQLMNAIADLAPNSDNDAHAPVSARVFKIERTQERARVAFVRIYSGTLTAREHIAYGDGKQGRVLHMDVYRPGGALPSPAASAGQIAAVQGLSDVRVGDVIGQPRPEQVERQFPPPTLESVVEALNRRDQARLRTALVELGEQDPLINVRQDKETDDLSVSLYGEVQREVIEATLARDYGIAAAFHDTTVIYVERPAGVASEEQVISAPTHTNISGRSSPDSTNPYNATLALRIEPLAPGSGVQVIVDVDVHLVPMYIYKTVEAFQAALTDYVGEALRRGLHGWEVTDCRVTVWDSGYSRTGSTARDFRLLTLMIMRTALERSGTLVCEPMARLKLDLPPSSSPAVGSTLAQLGARVLGQMSTDTNASIVALIPTSKLGEIKWRLPGMTSGQGVLETDFAGYMPVLGHPPERRARRPN